VGRVGTAQFYCWDCYIEFVVTKKGIQLFEVDDEGELVMLADDPEAGAGDASAQPAGVTQPTELQAGVVQPAESLQG